MPHSADLPVKAKAVEYVKICTTYGAGFFYIPGTDACIKLGGYLRADPTFNGGPHGQPAGAATSVRKTAIATILQVVPLKSPKQISTSAGHTAKAFDHRLWVVFRQPCVN